MKTTTFLICLAVSLAACKRSIDRGDVPPDGYKSPYLSTAADVPAAAPDTAAVAPAPVPRRPLAHPAASERPYPLMSLEELAINEKEKETLLMMTDPKRGGDVLERLKEAGPRSLTMVRMALTSTNRNIRMQAALLLANMKDTSKETIGVLCDSVLLDPDPDVRAISAKAFVVLRSPDAVWALLRSVREDPFETARANAAWALGNNPGKGVVDALKAALADKDTWVRLRAVSAIKKLNAREALQAMKDRACDPNAMVRERVRDTLKAWMGRDPGDKPAWCD